jgi:hypothetical protein
MANLYFQKQGLIIRKGMVLAWALERKNGENSHIGVAAFGPDITGSSANSRRSPGHPGNPGV